MARINVYGVSRAIWDDPDFADEAFTQREAWLWLVGAAAWKEIRTRGNSGAVVLNRGEFSFSLMFLARRFRWSKARVERFISALENRDTIRDASRDGAKIYFIKNYNRFNVVGVEKRDASEVDNRNAPETAAKRDRDKEETRETGKALTELDLTSFGLALSAACAAARARGGEFIRFPTNRFETSGEEVTIFDGNIIEFEELYPAVDVRQQIRAMKGWLLAKPERRKTRKGMMAFINSWLAREQNKAGNNGNSGLRDGQRRRTGHDSFNAAAASIAREFLGEQGGGFNDPDGDARETRPALLPP